MHSEYLSDQGKRAHLLDLLACMYESIADICAELLTMEHGGISEDEMEARRYRACTLAMDIQADWYMVEPILHDIYNDSAPVTNE